MPVVPHQLLRPIWRLAQPSCEPVLILASPHVSRTHTNDGALPSPEGQPGRYMIQHEPRGAPGAAMRAGVAGGASGGRGGGDAAGDTVIAIFWPKLQCGWQTTKRMPGVVTTASNRFAGEPPPPCEVDATSMPPLMTQLSKLAREGITQTLCRVLYMKESLSPTLTE